MNFDRGFTLVELCLAAALMSLITILAWPSLKGMLFETDVNSIAESLSATLIAVREQALEDGKRYRLSIDQKNASWEIAVESDPALCPGVFEPASHFPRRRQQSKRVAIARLSSPEIMFNPDGTAFDWFVTFAGKNRSRSVYFNAAGGTCEIK